MMIKKMFFFWAILLGSLMLPACMEDSGFNIVWTGLEVEFEKSALPDHAFTEVVFQEDRRSNQVDQTMVRINLVGAQLDVPVNVLIGIDTSSTAVQGVHYNIADMEVTIPANGSFVDLPVDILTGNLDAAESPDLVLNILDAGDVKVSVNYRSVTLRIRVACPSDLSGTYSTVTVGTEGTVNYQVTITEIEPLTYRISDITGGVYSLNYGEDDNPAIFTDLCNEITVFDQPDQVFENGTFNGTGRVNPDGTIVLTWENENEISGVTTLTKAN